MSGISKPFDGTVDGTVVVSSVTDPLVVTSITNAVDVTIPTFSMGGVNFTDYSLIKTLWMPSEANSASVQNFQDAGSDYQVPANHIFVAVRFAGSVEGVDTMCRIGEGLVTGDIVTDVLSLGTGTGKPFMEDVTGVWAATKYIKAKTDHSTNGLKANSALYGVEVDIS